MKTILIGLLLIQGTAFAEIGGLGTTDRSLIQYAERIKSVSDGLRKFDTLLTNLKQPTPYRRIEFKECGVANAFFSRDTRDITVCYEFVRKLDIDTRDAGPGAPEYQFLTLLFTIAHEYGHALIYSAQIPPLGREEDAADQLAAVILKKGGIAGQVLSAVGSSMMKRRSDDYKPNLATMADEHTMNAARLANLICWMGGEYPQVMTDAINAGRLTPQRAARCKDEAEQAERAVVGLLR